MPLNKAALSLEPDPRAVSLARRWVTAVCRELDRDDLVECAQLGVSELVTNALLHADAPLSVRVRGTLRTVRVEVSDGSRKAPVPIPETPVNSHGHANGTTHDELFSLATYGRGLNIVARCAEAWGAALEPAGKFVWFEPSREPKEDGPPAQPLLDLGTPTPRSQVDADPRAVRLREVPVAAVVSQRTHYYNLRREIALLALTHPDEYPLARQLNEAWSEFDEVFPPGALAAADQAIASDRESFDADVTIPEAGIEVLERLIHLFDEADRFCTDQRLLSLARTPGQRDFQRWYLGEFVRQGRGQDPTAWPRGPWGP